MYTKIIEGLKTAPKLKRTLFYWAISVGKKYSKLKLKQERIGFFLSFKHKIADKLIYSNNNKFFYIIIVISLVAAIYLITCNLLGVLKIKNYRTS